jgi:hypothetical protein
LTLLSGTWLLIAGLSTPAIVHADEPLPAPDHGKCITCHENLYFLHDTGNWYCLKESPMACVDCHGGDPLAVTQDLAHANRAAHPVINEDISKCQQCHPEECSERLGIFDRTAGIDYVRVAMPYTPRAGKVSAPATADEDREGFIAWMNAWEILPILLLSGAALSAYAIHKRHAAIRK